MDCCFCLLLLAKTSNKNVMARTSVFQLMHVYGINVMRMEMGTETVWMRGMEAELG